MSNLKLQKVKELLREDIVLFDYMNLVEDTSNISQTEMIEIVELFKKLAKDTCKTCPRCGNTILSFKRSKGLADKWICSNIECNGIW